MLDKTLKIFTPLMFGYLVGYWERTYAWNEKIRIHNNIVKDLLVDDN